MLHSVKVGYRRDLIQPASSHELAGFFCCADSLPEMLVSCLQAGGRPHLVELGWQPLSCRVLSPHAAVFGGVRIQSRSVGAAGRPPRLAPLTDGRRPDQIPRTG